MKLLAISALLTTGALAQISSTETFNIQGGSNATATGSGSLPTQLQSNGTSTPLQIAVSSGSNATIGLNATSTPLQIAVSSSGLNATSSALQIGVSSALNATSTPLQIGVSSINNGSALATPTQVLTTYTIAVVSMATASAAANGTGSIATGTGSASNGQTCTCQCLCGSNAFPSMAGMGNFGGVGGGSVPMVGAM